MTFSAARIAALKNRHDATLEVSDEELREARGLYYTTDLADLTNCNVYIVTVPHLSTSISVPIFRR